MKRLTNMNLDVYLFLKDFENRKGYCPSYREIQDNTNYKSICSIKQAVDKLEDLGMIKTARDRNGNIISRTIKTVDNEETRQLIKELRERLK